MIRVRVGDLIKEWKDFCKGIVKGNIVLFWCYNIIISIFDHITFSIGHLIGKLSKKYYFEDYIRVYPDIKFNKFGMKRDLNINDRKNFLNHLKVYIFASQFVNNKDVFDAGCGSGYGDKILKDKGARTVKGVDLSKHSIKYAKQRFGKDVGEDAFSVQNILKLTFEDDSFDVTICSEVLEHIKEYQKEEAGLQEMIRITKNKGILIIGVPNREHLRNHGFYFEELSELLKRNFESFVIFENALLPFERYGIESWQERLKNGKTGVVVTQSINFSEVILPENLNGINDLRGF